MFISRPPMDESHSCSSQCWRDQGRAFPRFGESPCIAPKECGTTCIALTWCDLRVKDLCRWLCAVDDVKLGELFEISSTYRKIIFAMMLQIFRKPWWARVSEDKKSLKIIHREEQKGGKYAKMWEILRRWKRCLWGDPWGVMPRARCACVYAYMCARMGAVRGDAIGQVSDV